jgi:hypothetical protein
MNVSLRTGGVCFSVSRLNPKLTNDFGQKTIGLLLPWALLFI